MFYDVTTPLGQKRCETEQRVKLADELDDLKEIADLLAARDFVNAREKVVAVTMGSPVIDEESKKQRANATPA